MLQAIACCTIYLCHIGCASRGKTWWAVGGVTCRIIEWLWFFDWQHCSSQGLRTVWCQSAHGMGAGGFVINLSVHPAVRRWIISKTTRPNFTKFVVDVEYRRGSVLLAIRYVYVRFCVWSRVFMCWIQWRVSLPQQYRCSVVHGLTPLLHDTNWFSLAWRRAPRLDVFIVKAVSRAKFAMHHCLDARLPAVPLSTILDKLSIHMHLS